MTHRNFTVPAALATFVLSLAACVGSTPDAGDDAVGEDSAAINVCPFKIKCAPGYHPVDTDGDKCPDACELKCDIAIRCAPGYHSVDTNNDGCPDTCEPDGGVSSIACPLGWEPVDTDNDGVLDTCIEVCPQIVCAPGYYPIDTNDDNCLDSCVPDWI